MTQAPVLVACAHGTRSPTGRRLIAELALAARSLRPGLVTTAAFVDASLPPCRRRAELYRRAPAVVVPCFCRAASRSRGHRGAVSGSSPPWPPARSARSPVVEVLHDRLLQPAPTRDPRRRPCWPRRARATSGGRRVEGTAALPAARAGASAPLRVAAAPTCPTRWPPPRAGAARVVVAAIARAGPLPRQAGPGPVRTPSPLPCGRRPDRRRPSTGTTPRRSMLKTAQPPPGPVADGDHD